jgi:thymidylate synthase (FAD)
MIIMHICKPQVLIPKDQIAPDIVKKVERYARVCYKSEDHMGVNENSNYLRSIIRSGHESVIEHEKITVLFVIDRGVSHEIVRHRLASYSQESTRYCNYGKDKFGNEITVIEPFFFIGTDAYKEWKDACLYAEKCYISLLDHKRLPQEARAVLPNSLKTELVVTYNLREWRHFFKLRCSNNAHPQMRQVAIPLLLFLKDRLPVFFEDIAYGDNFPAEHFADIVLTDELFNPC